MARVGTALFLAAACVAGRLPSPVPPGMRAGRLPATQVAATNKAGQRRDAILNWSGTDHENKKKNALFHQERRQ